MGRWDAILRSWVGYGRPSVKTSRRSGAELVCRAPPSPRRPHGPDTRVAARASSRVGCNLMTRVGCERGVGVGEGDQAVRTDKMSVP